MQLTETVDELTKTAYNKLGINDNFEKLVYELEKGNDRTVFITDSKGHLLGFISLENVLKNSKGPIPLKKIYTKLPLIKDFDEEKIMDTFLEKNISLIPVVDQKETIQSVFSIFKVVNNFLLDTEYATDDIVEPIPVKIQASDKIERLLAEVKKNYFDYYLVENKDQFTGFVDSKNLVNLLIPQERTSRGEKIGEKQKFDVAIDNYLIDSSHIVIDHQESYATSFLLKQMEKNNTTVLFLRNKDKSITNMITLRKIVTVSLKAQDQGLINANIAVLSAPDADIEQIARRKVATLIDRHAKFFNAETESEGTVRFHKIENQSQRGMFKYEADIRISFGKGKDSIFSVKADDWGSEKSLNRAYTKVSRLISDKRKFLRDVYQKKEVIE